MRAGRTDAAYGRDNTWNMRLAVEMKGYTWR